MFYYVDYWKLSDWPGQIEIFELMYKKELLLLLFLSLVDSAVGAEKRDRVCTQTKFLTQTKSLLCSPGDVSIALFI